MTKEELFEKNKQVLRKYLPEKVLDRIGTLIFEYDFKLIIKGDRRSKWGDFRPPTNHKPAQITVNKSLNKYSFLMTLIHEIAHCKTFRECGNTIEPHGTEWKKNFQILMQDFMNTDVFPIDILYVLRKHMQNPTASANADTQLYKVLKNYDMDNARSPLIMLEYLPNNHLFVYEGKIYQRIRILKKRIECLHIETNKKYLFSPIAEVEIYEAQTRYQTSVNTDTLNEFYKDKIFEKRRCF